ncbi:MAG: hypothetical protein AAF986_07980 [Pseudomonadota bacterium]
MKPYDDRQTKDIELPLRETGVPALSVDYAYYAQYLRDTDLTEDQKRDFIRSFAGILMAFVDLGFGIAPDQSPLKELTKNLHETAVFPPGSPPDMVQSEPDIQDILEPQAEGDPTAEGSDS